MVASRKRAVSGCVRLRISGRLIRALEPRWPAGQAQAGAWAHCPGGERQRVLLAQGWFP